MPVPSRIVIKTIQHVSCQVCGEELGAFDSDIIAAHQAGLAHPECPDPIKLACGALIQISPDGWDIDKRSTVAQDDMAAADVAEAWTHVDRLRGAA